MVLTPSMMVPLHAKAADFSLIEPASGKKRSFQELKGAKGTLVMFICNHCPYVKHIRHGIVQFAKEYQPLGLGIIAINANDAIQFPDDSPEKMIITAQEEGFTFPYLFDESQEVAKAYQAACTPDFFLFDIYNELVYRGQFDSSRPGNKHLITGHDLRAAVDALLSNKKISAIQQPSMGCNIKWK